jgi:hypothetical protein
MEARVDSLLGEYESGRITRRHLIALLTLFVASRAAASDSDSMYRATEQWVVVPNAFPESCVEG